jgi:hypothetical protein
MQPSNGRWGSKYEKVSTVIDELQPMAHRIQKPLMMSTQFNRQLKKGALIGDASQVGYAYEIVQNADIVLAMYRDEDLKASNRMLISIMEHREGEDYTMLTRWDLNEMNFEFVRQVHQSELTQDSGDGGAAVAAVSF